MKRSLTLALMGAIVFALPVAGIAAPKKEAAAAAAGEVKKAAEKPAADAATKVRTLGMFVKVDSIDAAAKTFSHTNKDGTTVKFVVTDTTEIKNGDAPAKLSDIKVGDTVSGSRIKKSATEYEVVKITKFGVFVPKEKAAPADKKPAAEKKAGDKKPQ